MLHLGDMTTGKIVVEVCPNYLSPVTLRLRNLGTQALAEWTAGLPPHGVTSRLILDPQQQDPEP
jgi:hypothetical protein